MAQALVNDAVKWIKSANAHDHEFVTLRMDKALALAAAAMSVKNSVQTKKTGKVQNVG
jgi:hypothetical protein